MLRKNSSFCDDLVEPDNWNLSGFAFADVAGGTNVHKQNSLETFPILIGFARGCIVR